MSQNGDAGNGTATGALQHTAARSTARYTAATGPYFETARCSNCWRQSHRDEVVVDYERSMTDCSTWLGGDWRKRWDVVAGRCLG